MSATAEGKPDFLATSNVKSEVKGKELPIPKKKLQKWQSGIFFSLDIPIPRMLTFGLSVFPGDLSPKMSDSIFPSERVNSNVASASIRKPHILPNCTTAISHEAENTTERPKASQEEVSRVESELEARPMDESEAKTMDEGKANAMDESVAMGESEFKAKDGSEADESEAKAMDESEAKAMDESEAKAMDESEVKAMCEGEEKAPEETDAKATDESEANARDDSD
eukprot:887409-Amorphochlora_amoeboformis.AAC.1